jgi:hypothetical protein
MNGEMAIISVLLGSSDRTQSRFQHSDATIYYPSTTNIPRTNYILSIRLTRDTIYYTFLYCRDFYSNKHAQPLRRTLRRNHMRTLRRNHMRTLRRNHMRTLRRNHMRTLRRNHMRNHYYLGTLTILNIIFLLFYC